MAAAAPHFCFPGLSLYSRSLPAAARLACWMPLLSRLFPATSQSVRLLRSLPHSPPRPYISRLAHPVPIRTLYTTMPAFSNRSPPSAHPIETHDNFDLVKRFKLDFADIHVSKWRSRDSGLSVVHLDYDGTPPEILLSCSCAYCGTAPLVNGYFVVGTESMCLPIASHSSHAVARPYSKT